MNAPQADNRLAPLDALRGLAIAGVVAVHSAAAVPTGVPRVDALLAGGRFGVQLFFLVSAFTMFHMWQLRAGEVRRTRNFYIRRFLRIAPPFWLAIPVYLALQGTGPGYWAPEGIGLTEIALTATFLHALWPSAINSVVPGGWSIGVEMMFYALFPLIALRVRRPQTLIWLAVLASMANQVLIEPLTHTWLSTHYRTPSGSLVRDFLYLGFFNQLPVLLLGCHLFHAYKLPARQWLAAVVPPIAAWTLAIIALRLVGGRPNYTALLALIPVMYAAATVVLRTGLAPALLTALGRHSYGIYLSHMLVLHWLGTLLDAPWKGPGPWLLMYAATLLLATACSMVLRRLVEEPAARLARALTARSAKAVLRPAPVRS